MEKMPRMRRPAKVFDGISGKRMRALCFAGMLLVAPSPGLGEQRTFTDTSGRSIVAELMGANEESIRIRREDGRVFDLALAKLSEIDRQYVAAWKVERAFAFGGLDVTARRVRIDTERKQTRSSTRSSEEWCFKFKVMNRSRLDLEGLTAEYRVFYVEDSATADQEKLPEKRVSGRVAIGTLAAGAEIDLQSSSVNLDIIQLKPGYRYAGTSKRRVEDSLSGFWVRIMRGNEVLHEFALPTSLTKTGSW